MFESKKLTVVLRFETAHFSERKLFNVVLKFAQVDLLLSLGSQIPSMSSMYLL
jgi:hypothetical protein